MFSASGGKREEIVFWGTTDGQITFFSFFNFQTYLVKKTKQQKAEKYLSLSEKLLKVLYGGFSAH